MTIDAITLQKLWNRQFNTEVIEIGGMEFQNATHPYTCPNRDINHIENTSDRGALVPTLNGWICICCDYRQPYGCEVAPRACAQSMRPEHKNINLNA